MRVGDIVNLSGLAETADSTNLDVNDAAGAGLKGNRGIARR